jgi:hypothetical protein
VKRNLLEVNRRSSLSVSEKTQGYANLKTYKEFAAENRPEGWNVWFTVAFSPAPPERPASETPPLVTK